MRFSLIVAMLLLRGASQATDAQAATDALVTGAHDGDTLYVEAAIWPRLT